MLRSLQFVVVVLGILFLPSLAVTKSKPVVAVFKIEDKTGTLSEDQLQSLTDYLSSKLAESGLFLIIPQSQLKARLTQQKLESYKACYDQKCQIQIGRELAAGKSISSKVMKLGTKCTFTTVLYDLRKAASEGAASSKGDCTVDGLVKSINGVVTKLTKSLKPSTRKTLALKGGLLIKSDPSGAEVWLDGVKQKGLTPVTLKNLSAEDHLLVIRKGQRQYQDMVRVKPNSFSTISATLKKPGGQIEVLSEPPEASVFLDGRPLGKTPQVLKDIVYGQHLLELRKEGYLVTRKTVQVDAKKRALSLDISLQRAGIIEVSSDPKGATVFLDGEIVGNSPAVLSVALGKHTISVKMEGRVPLTKDVFALSDKKNAVTFHMEMTEAMKQKVAEAEKHYQSKLEQWQKIKQHRKDKNLWGFISLGVGIGLAVAGGIVYGIGQTQKNDAYDKYHAVEGFNVEEMDRHLNDAEKGRTKAIAGLIIMGSSAIPLGYSLYQFLTRPTLEEQPQPDKMMPAVSLLPTPKGAVLSIGGTY